jgi:hypothetical protein
MDAILARLLLRRGAMQSSVPVAFCTGVVAAVVALRVLDSWCNKRSHEPGAAQGAAKPAAAANAAAPSSDDGGDVVFVTAERLTAEALIAAVASPKAGAIVTFNGVTRDNFDGRAVTRLEYVS